MVRQNRRDAGSSDIKLCCSRSVIFDHCDRRFGARLPERTDRRVAVTYNAGYSTSITPEDSTDISSRTRSNVFLQSLIATRTMDFWAAPASLDDSAYAFANTSSSTVAASTNGLSDVAFLWQINIFGGPALTREQFQSFIPQNLLDFSSLRRHAARHLQSNLTD